MAVKCELCSVEVPDYLADHLLDMHQLSVAEYQELYPGASVMSDRLAQRFQTKALLVQRALPPPPDQLTVPFANLRFPINIDVPSSACLPLPAHYHLPQYGDLGKDVQHAVVGLFHRRSLYIWGLPGSGKDALFHAFSSMTRTPALLRQVKPGTDIEAWFFSRAFNEKGTYWEEGEVLKALRDGYTTPTGRKVPYLVLITDFDRADREQAENIRLITDSIQGRIDGPAGHTYDVLPGTRIVATANTSGGGDERGRMVSANPIDASLMDRFDRKYEFHWMDWRDEGLILQAKFPHLIQRCPSILTKMETVTVKLREAIQKDNLHAEFSHRALCAILGHAQDILDCAGKPDKKLLKMATRAWLDGLPDKENRQTAANIMDPTIGLLEEGDTSHISDEDLATALQFGED